MTRGFFITIDGGDGAGKSVQAKRLEEALRADGIPVLLCRDPGSTRLGEAVREILLGRVEIEICPQSEMFLFMAARAEMVHETILPALKEGSVVIADRFLLSTLVYQGIAGGLPLDEILRAGQMAVRGRFPDMTILLDLPAETGMARIDRPLDRIEQKGLAFHKKVEAGYREALKFLAEKSGTTPLLIDAARDPDVIAREIYGAVTRLLRAGGAGRQE